MGYRLVRADQVPAAPGPHPAASAYDRGIGEALGVSAFGLYQVELPPGETTVLHDHVDDQAQDAYVILSGHGVVVADGDEVAVAPGDFIAIDAESRRQVRAAADGLTFIAVCASP